MRGSLDAALGDDNEPDKPAKTDAPAASDFADLTRPTAPASEAPVADAPAETFAAPPLPPPPVNAAPPAPVDPPAAKEPAPKKKASLAALLGDDPAPAPKPPTPGDTGWAPTFMTATTEAAAQAGETSLASLAAQSVAGKPTARKPATPPTSPAPEPADAFKADHTFAVDLPNVEAHPSSTPPPSLPPRVVDEPAVPVEAIDEPDQFEWPAPPNARPARPERADSFAPTDRILARRREVGEPRPATQRARGSNPDIDWQSRALSAEGRVASLIVELERANHTIIEQRERAAGYDMHRAEWNEQIAVRDATLREQDEALRAYRARITELEADVADRVKMLDELQAARSGRKASQITITQLQSEVAAGRERIAHLEAALTDMTEQRNAFRRPKPLRANLQPDAEPTQAPPAKKAAAKRAPATAKKAAAPAAKAGTAKGTATKKATDRPKRTQPLKATRIPPGSSANGKTNGKKG